ncbi:unnamed protein product [Brassicogethes aeneus]|uniref:Tc1-like transposase DDE domain-containing protein n=1 Tax=Brassicogethes aeneus TaxID=1431903 RepID=A0A9P0B452_BRAAE|nr:unnamed protein product [Brassicogethes aeneus]
MECLKAEVMMEGESEEFEYNKWHNIVLRLPPYHPELNPIEGIWALLKNHIAAHNVTFKLDDVWKLAEDKLKNIGVEEWEKVCAHVAKSEEEYISREHFTDDVHEFIIRVNNDSKSECNYFSSNEDDNDF